jgi:hypothetical protein
MTNEQFDTYLEPKSGGVEVIMGVNYAFPPLITTKTSKTSFLVTTIINNSIQIQLPIMSSCSENFNLVTISFIGTLETY